MFRKIALSLTVTLGTLMISFNANAYDFCKYGGSYVKHSHCLSFAKGSQGTTVSNNCDTGILYYFCYHWDSDVSSKYICNSNDPEPTQFIGIAANSSTFFSDGRNGHKYWAHKCQ